MWTHPDRPYQDLPPLPPAGQVETPVVLKASIAANAALARLDGAHRLLPDPTMLINIIPLLEAQASSEIENIVTTNDELFRASAGMLEQMTPQTKEALRYREALQAGFESLARRPLTMHTATLVCSHIQHHEALIRSHHGTYIGNPTTQERIYTPPQGKDIILRHLEQWQTFIHDDHGIDPLIVMALAHYQFEAIHPFSDGNGRTGRILNLLLLIEANLLQLPILYLSGYIVRHKTEYYERLNAVTRNDEWEQWVLFMLEAVRYTATWTYELITKTADLRQAFEERLLADFPRMPAGDLARICFTQPYLRIDNIVDAHLAKRQTASRWLNELTAAGMLERHKVGKYAVFINHELVSMLFNTDLDM